MVNKELHPFPDTCSLLRIFFVPLVCTLVLFESINHPADDVQPFHIAFVFSIFLNNVTRCTAVWSFLRFQEGSKMVGDNPCQTCVQRPDVFIRHFRISLVAFGFPRFFFPCRCLVHIFSFSGKGIRAKCQIVAEQKNNLLMLQFSTLLDFLCKQIKRYSKMTLKGLIMKVDFDSLLPYLEK